MGLLLVPVVLVLAIALPVFSLRIAHQVVTNRPLDFGPALFATVAAWVGDAIVGCGIASILPSDLTWVAGLLQILVWMLAVSWVCGLDLIETVAVGFVSLVLQFGVTAALAGLVFGAYWLVGT